MRRQGQARLLKALPLQDLDAIARVLAVCLTGKRQRDSIAM